MCWVGVSHHIPGDAQVGGGWRLKRQQAQERASGPQREERDKEPGWPPAAWSNQPAGRASGPTGALGTHSCQL